MIIDAIVGWIVSAFTQLYNLLPVADLDIGANKAAWGTLSGLNYFLPIAETVAVVVALFAIGPAMIVATLSIWLTVGVIRGGASTA